ncbi:ATP-binding protein [Vibrio sp. MA40-2]|uniref:ATP-binding protein n=1 Tax=Vibrio sp. MA40-2 TaxID=3391828 RepID=UPI0039A73ECA
MKNRKLSQYVEDAMIDTPVVALLGARQVGKTTLAKKFVPESRYHRVSLDDKGMRDLANNDPKAFISSLKKPALIDEIQKCPALTSNLKLLVDESREDGSFIITGSADLRILSQFQNKSEASDHGDSMAGRIEWLRLYTFTQAEIHDAESSFIRSALQNHFEQTETILTREQLIERIVLGGYPEIQRRRPHRRSAWFDNYIESIVRQDLKEVYSIEKSDEAIKTLKLLAINSSKLLNKSAIYKNVGVAKETGNRFISAMASAYLMHYVPAFHQNETKAVVASPKIVTLDSGLHCFLRDKNYDDLVMNPEVLGDVVENFVIAELIKLSSLYPENCTVNHYRTKDGAIEVDAILTSRGISVGIEVKSGMTVKDSWKKPIQKLVDDGVISHGFIIYTGDRLIKISEKITLLPISNLMCFE